MKDLEKQKTDLHSTFWGMVTTGICAAVMVFLTLFLGYRYPKSHLTLMVTSLTLMLTGWLISYIDYRLLKLKIEITEELSK